VVIGQMANRVDLLRVCEALRVLRHNFRQSGRYVRRTTNKIKPHIPFGGLAGTVLKEVETVAKDADRIASDVARKVLVGAPVEPKRSDLLLTESDESDLAAIAYSVLSSIVSHLGMSDAYVSEAAARRAFARHAGFDGLDNPGSAAALFFSFLDEKVVTQSHVASPEDTNEATPETVPIFALLLWLQSDCNDPYDGRMLFAAADMAKALQKEIEIAARQRDESRLIVLFEEFASHV
jgi:hypothetical protein